MDEKDLAQDSDVDVPVPDSEQSLDDIVNSAYDQIEQASPDEEKSTQTQRARDEAGRFARQADLPDAAKEQKAAKNALAAKVPAAAATTVAAPVTVGDTASPTVQAPNTWTPAVKAKFATLEPDVQAEIMKREQDMARAITLHDQDRSFGKTVKDVVTPYLPMIQAEGATPETAIQSLLNTAYRLRTSSPQEKGVLLANLARQYGADLSAFAGEGSQEQAPIDPTVAALQQKLQQLEGFITQQHTQQQTQAEQNLLRDINAFAADPAHPHFETVGQQMAGLIKAGLAADLQQAYEQAIYLHPEVRQQVISAQQTEAQRKQIEEAKQKAAKAKQLASVNLTSKPSLPTKSMNGSLDQLLSDAYDNVMGNA